MGANSRGPGVGPSRGAAGDDLPDAVVSELRSDERCRTIASVLAAENEPMPLIDLAREVLARERAEGGEDPDLLTGGAVGSEDVADVRTEIYGRDLPKLTAAGVVSFDSLVSTVSLTSEGERLLDEER